MSAATSGAFTPHRPDGAVDLSGIVKALGIQAAAAVLDAHGVRDYVLNAGGDVVVSGAQPDGRPWVVGIVDPDGRLLFAHADLSGYSVFEEASWWGERAARLAAAS